MNFSQQPLASTSSSWWNASDSAGQPASHQPSSYASSSLDDRMDDSSLAPSDGNHLPGFLTRARSSANTNDGGPYSPGGGGRGGDLQPWNLSSSYQGMPSPTYRHNAPQSLGGGLFDSQSSPRQSMAQPRARAAFADDAPPTQSMDDEEDIPPSSSAYRHQHNQYEVPQHQQHQYHSSSFQSQLSPPPGPSPDLKTASGSLGAVPSPSSSVIVFGLPPTLLSPLLEHFAHYGTILSSHPDPSGGNWVTLTYASDVEASRALAHSGDVLGGTWMVGVKPLNPDAVYSTTPRGPSPSQFAPALAGPSRTPAVQPSAATSSTVGTPLRLAPSSSAFRPLGAPSSTASSAAPSPSAKQAALVRAGTPSSAQQGQGGVLSKLGELVFGF